MIKYVVTLSILFLSYACTTRPSYLSTIKSNPKIKIKVHDIHTPKDAQYFIQNQLNFLGLLFQQSRDPYYGTPKWSEKCLKENVIGKIKHSPDGFWVESVLYLDASGFPGHCSETMGATESVLIFVFCQKEANLLEIKYPMIEKLNSMNTNLCN